MEHRGDTGPGPIIGGGYGDAIACPSRTMCVACWRIGPPRHHRRLGNLDDEPELRALCSSFLPDNPDVRCHGVDWIIRLQRWRRRSSPLLTGERAGQQRPKHRFTEGSAESIVLRRPLVTRAITDTLSDQTIPGAVLATTNGGRTWANQPFPPSIGSMTDIVCPTVSVCYAVADTTDPTGNFGQADLFATNDAGAIWTSTRLPLNGSEPTGLACPSSLSCLFISLSGLGKPQILTTSDGGETWRLHAITPIRRRTWARYLAPRRQSVTPSGTESSFRPMPE